MKEPLDELLVQACAAQQRADLAALEQLEPANVPMPFVPQVRRTPRRLLKTVIIAAVCAVLATTAYAFWPRVAVILEGSRAYLAVQEAPQNSIPMEQMQLTWLPDGCTVTWDDSTYQKYGAYSCLIDNGKQSKEHQVLGIAQMPLENLLTDHDTVTLGKLFNRSRSRRTRSDFVHIIISASLPRSSSSSLRVRWNSSSYGL